MEIKAWIGRRVPETSIFPWACHIGSPYKEKLAKVDTPILPLTTCTSTLGYAAVRMTFTHATYGPLKENAMLTRSG